MDQVANLVHRPRLYYNVDGLGELGIGVMCLGCALLWWLLANTAADTVWHKGAIFFFFALIAVIHFGTKAIKERITYPRTGFVAYRKRDRRITAMIAAPVGALVVFGLAMVVRGHWDVTGVALLFGPALAASYAYGFARASGWKWIVVVVMLLASVAIALLPPSTLAALASDSGSGRPILTRAFGTLLVTLIVYGAVLMISGAVSFWLYLRHTQAPAQESQ